MSKWYLIRHGETAWNATGRMQGHTDTPLSSLGRRQAHRLAMRLALADITAAFSSDLGRATETMRIVLQGRPVQGTCMEALREALQGAWEGLTYGEAQSKYPDEYARLLQRDLSVAAPAGESALDIMRRIKTAVGTIHGQNSGGGDLLIVGHSGGLRAIAVSVLGLPAASFWSLRVEPGSLSILAVEGESAALELWNDVSHLADLDGD